MYATRGSAPTERSMGMPRNRRVVGAAPAVNPERDARDRQVVKLCLCKRNQADFRAKVPNAVSVEAPIGQPSPEATQLINLRVVQIGSRDDDAQSIRRAGGRRALHCPDRDESIPRPACFIGGRAFDHSRQMRIVKGRGANLGTSEKDKGNQDRQSLEHSGWLGRFG